MSRIVWDRAGEHIYETGVDHGVLYPTKVGGGGYDRGVAWNGLTSVSESPSGAESTGQYADNIKYLNLVAAEEFGATVEAFTYPPEFGVCDGSAMPVRGVMIGQQTRRPFGLSYRTLVGNDLEGTEYGYKIHLIYGATAAPSQRAYGTVNDSPEAITFSWEVNTTPVEVPGYKPTASLVIDSTMVSPAAMAKLEDIIYGTATEEPRLPMPEEVIALVGSTSSIELVVTAPDGTTDLLGKTASELQENITISTDNLISGKLLYVTDYTGFSNQPSEQQGNYLALKIVDDAGSTASRTFELLGGKSGEKAIDSDGLIVLRITNANTQSLRVTITEAKDSITKVYSLKDLELASAASLG